MEQPTDLGTPVNTCLSAGTDIQDEVLSRAKDYLTKNYNNKYNLMPHLTYMICPFPASNLEIIKNDIDQYFEGKKSFVLKLAELHYEPIRKFYSIPVIGDEIKKFHEDLVYLFNKGRDGCIRAKDLLKIQAGERDSEDIELIKKYGYFRIFDRFTPHITVGNIETEDINVTEITNTLNKILSEVMGQGIKIDRVHVTFHTDAEVQTEMQEIWGKDYLLD